MPDGDILSVVIYLMDGTKRRVNAITSGTCTLTYNNHEYAVAEFDRTYGNEDGCVKIAFNHPGTTTGEARVHVVTATETLDALFPVTVLPMPDVHVSGNDF